MARCYLCHSSILIAVVCAFSLTAIGAQGSGRRLGADSPEVPLAPSPPVEPLWPQESDPPSWPSLGDGPSVPPPPPNAPAPSYLLPERLQPDAAYFDAAIGVTHYGSPRRSFARFWDEVPSSSDRTVNRLQLVGGCTYNRPSKAGSSHASIRFNGRSCIGIMADHNLTGWNTDGSSAFTAVWIGRFDRNSKDSQTFMTLSRTPEDYDAELYWTTNGTFMYSFASDVAADLTVEPPRKGEWMMEVISRSPVEGVDGVKVSYYRYGQSDTELSKWQFDGVPCLLGPDNLTVGGDTLDGSNYFKGDLAAVLVYNRALRSREVRSLAIFYGSRFGWAKPRRSGN